MVILYFDVKLCGEPDHHPQTRIASLRDSVYTKLVTGVLEVREMDDSPTALPSGDIAILLDGHKHGNKAMFVKPWKKKTDDAAAGIIMEKTNFVFYDEVSLRNRRGLTRGTNSLTRVELMHVLSADNINLPEVPYEVYQGTNKGDAMGPVALDLLAEDLTSIF